MNTPKFSAEPNPLYPATKGQRAFCIIRTDLDGKQTMLAKQFNVRHTAAREALRIQVAYERRVGAVPYLGD